MFSTVQFYEITNIMKSLKNSLEFVTWSLLMYLAVPNNYQVAEVSV